MKNVQVIDGAENCTYDIYSISEEQFEKIFVEDTDVQFVSDIIDRLGNDISEKILQDMWKSRKDKKFINGLHGIIFFDLDFKKKYYPTRKEVEMIANPMK